MNEMNETNGATVAPSKPGTVDTPEFRRMLIEYRRTGALAEQHLHVGNLIAHIDAHTERAVAAKQAEIDRLMLEFCPAEMSAAQMAAWDAHQCKATKHLPRTTQIVTSYTLAAPQQHAQAAQPFMYGIIGPDGKAFFDEHCVDPNEDGLHLTVNGLNDSPDAGYSVVPLYTSPPAAVQPDSVPSAPTDISAQLREYSANPGYSHNDYADVMRIAADECERFYGGMMAWKKTAETKDRKLSEEMTARINERVAARIAEHQPDSGRDAALATARAEGRAEAVLIILAMEPEDALNDCMAGSGPCPATGEYDTHWDEAKLRAKFMAGDTTINMEAKAELAYYEYTEARMFLQYETEQRRAGQPRQRAAPPSGWKLVPIEPTETMVIDGFESAPDKMFDGEDYPEEYDAMSGCQQAAFRARRCYAAMLAAAPAAPGDGEA